MSELIIGKRKAVSNWLRQFVTILDPEKKVYKIQESLLSLFKWGEYKQLPKIDYVLIFRQIFAKCESCPVDEIEKSNASFYQVSLVHNGNRRIIVHETRNREEAFEMAEKAGIALHARIKDNATTRGKSFWLS